MNARNSAHDFSVKLSPCICSHTPLTCLPLEPLKETDNMSDKQAFPWHPGTRGQTSYGTVKPCGIGNVHAGHPALCSWSNLGRQRNMNDLDFFSGSVCPRREHL